MLQLLTCSKGHSWEAAADDDGAAVGRGRCPVCGEAVDLLPLFDLEPAPVAITAAMAPVLPQAPPLCDAAGRPVAAGFEIQEDLGRTPLGVRLYKARQLLVNRTVLLKVVVARDDSGQTGWGALRGEAAALGRLNHPNIAQILEAGERERQLFYNVVEWVEGPTLVEYAAGKPLPPRQAALLVEVLARAVHAAHELGQVHRGLRPACIRLQPQNADDKKRKPEPVGPPFWLAGGARFLPKITGFGLARRPVEGDPADVELYEGMPSYLSPEQAWGRGREIGAASDVYALGALLYELLSGQPPFRGRTPGETLDFIRSGDLPAFLRPGRFPAELTAVCRRAMQRQPKNRYKTALDLADDLRAFASSRPVKARQAGAFERAGMWVRRRPLAALLALVCVLAAGGVLTAYFYGAGETAESKAELDSALSRATAAENREAGLRRDLAESQKREKQAAYYHEILLAEREWRVGDVAAARQMLDRCDPELRHWEWHYLDYQTSPGATQFDRLTGPEQPVGGVAFSPDGDRLAAASGDDLKREVRVWPLPDLTTDHVLTGFLGPITRIAFSPDGKRLATASSAPGDFGAAAVGEVKEWDPIEDRLVLTRRIEGGLPTDLVYSQDGKRLLVVDDRGKVHLYLGGSVGEAPLDLSAGWNWKTRNFRLAVLTPDGAKLALPDAEGNQIQIHDTRRGPGSVPGAQHTDEILALAFSPATNWLASASRDGTAQVWDVQTNRLVSTLRGHTAAVTGVSFTRDGRRLATCGDDGDVRVWDPGSGQEVFRLTPFDKGAAEGNAVTAVQFRPGRDDWQLAAAHGTEVRIFGPPRP